MPFKSYAAGGFLTELLPILPPDAQISPRSKAGDNLLASRGKVPGKLAQDGWFGFGDWTNHVSKDEDVSKWSSWRCGVGLQGRKYIGVDIDVDQGGLADAIEAEALSTLGVAPSRRGRAGRRLLVYSCPGLRKRRLAFRVGGGFDDPAPGHGVPGAQLQGSDGLGDVHEIATQNGGVAYAVEILGDGQQYVVEGIHPKTGQPYSWVDGRSPCAFGAGGLTVVSADQVDAFLERAAWLVENLWDGEIISSAGRGGDAAGGAVWQGSLQAPSLAAVRDALAAIPNDVDYDDWIRVMAMTKAATEGLEA